MTSPHGPSQSQPAEDLSPGSERVFFRELGVRTFINAAGTYTLLSASLMLPEVVAAMSFAAKHFVDIEELQTAAGKRIAALIGCEAAMVTSGAAAALTIGTAACLTGENPVYVRQIPDLTGLKSEVIIQRAHRFLYDHAIRNCGVKFVEIETVAQASQRCAVRDRFEGYPAAIATDDGSPRWTARKAIDERVEPHPGVGIQVAQPHVTRSIRVACIKIGRISFKHDELTIGADPAGDYLACGVSGVDRQTRIASGD